MMWKWCLLLVMLSAWQACSAQLVNLVEPHYGSYCPPQDRFRFEFLELFDHDISTYRTVHRGYSELELGMAGSYAIRPTNYRIIIPAHVPSAEYPSSWKVFAESADPNQDRLFVLDSVTGAVFKDGVYEGTLRKQINIWKLEIKFVQKVVTIAEVELLGPQSALDALWPYGDYPCSQRLAWITSKRGPRTIFYKSKNIVSYEELRGIFHPDRLAWPAVFNFDGTKPIIIGAKLPNLPMVQEVTFDMTSFVVKRVVLQGNMCENDNCRNLRSKGWVKLGVRFWWGLTEHLKRIPVKNPGPYKAYRLKFIPRNAQVARDNDGFYMRGLYFSGCTA